MSALFFGSRSSSSSLAFLESPAPHYCNLPYPESWIVPAVLVTSVHSSILHFYFFILHLFLHTAEARSLVHGLPT
jgi:hypothetical protein